MNGRLLPRADLRDRDVQAMYELLARHFEGVDEHGFREDLYGKDWVILLEREGRGLLGFSTLRLDVERHEGLTYTVAYSGDTIVAPEGWGTPVLPRTWIRSVRALHRRHGEGALLWLLLTSGFRTFRFLPVFCRTYHSGPAREDAAGLESLAGVLAGRRFGPAYDPATGVVRLPHPQRLRDSLIDVPAGRLEDPHVRRFVRLNPGHARGDELVSLAPLDDANLTRAGLRMLHGRREARTAP